jgi:uncharacterized membrane-anchored protein YitT (DUF2179 family)
MSLRTSVNSLLKDVLLDFCASVFYGMGIVSFARPAAFAPGGITGIVLILNHIFGAPIGVLSLAVNLPLILIAYKFVGKSFLLRTLRSVIVSTFFLDFVFPYLPAYGGSRLIAAVMSGITLGIALSIFYRNGSSSGGSDLVCVSIKAKRPSASLGRIGIAIDFVVVLSSYPVFGNVDSVLLGIIAGVVTGLTVDRLSEGPEN